MQRRLNGYVLKLQLVIPAVLAILANAIQVIKGIVKKVVENFGIMYTLRLNSPGSLQLS